MLAGVDVNYLAGNCGLTGSWCVDVVVLCRVEPDNNDRDSDDGLSSGVDVLTLHCQLRTSTASRHAPFIQNISKCDILSYVHQQSTDSLHFRFPSVRSIFWKLLQWRNVPEQVRERKYVDNVRILSVDKESCRVDERFVDILKNDE